MSGLGATVEQVAARCRVPPGLVRAVFLDERRRGRLERAADGRWAFTARGWAEIGAPLAAIDRPPRERRAS
jgi:hypothetical protein